MYLYVLANEMKRTDKITEIMQQRKEKEIQALNKVSTTQTKCLHVNNCIVLYYLIVLIVSISQSLVEYRKENQRIEDRREFDLNDPDFKQKDLPARVSHISVILSILHNTLDF